MNKLRARSLPTNRRRALLPVALFNIFVMLSLRPEAVHCLDELIDAEENEGALGFLRAVEDTIEAKTMWFYRHFGANIDPSKISRASRCDYSKAENSINCPPAFDKNIPKQNPNLYAGAQTGNDSPLSLKNRASFISIPPRCLEDPDGPDCRNLRSLGHNDTPLPGIGMINDESDLTTFAGVPTLAPESDTSRDIFLTARPTPPVGATSTFEPTRDMCYGNHDSFKQSAMGSDEMTNVRGKWCESTMPSVSLEPSGAPTVFPEGGRDVEYGYLSEEPSETPSTEDWIPPPGLEFKDKAWSSPPSGLPSDGPSLYLSTPPSGQPSDGPSLYPSINPSGQPSDGPSLYPSSSPSETPSGKPSAAPSTGGWTPPPGLEFKNPASSLVPSGQPSDGPSLYPSINPSGQPSDGPSLYPSASPSETPSGKPSAVPSTTDWNPPPGLEFKNPASSFIPSKQPSVGPSLHPSASPSEMPSGKPSAVPLTRDWNPPPAFHRGPAISSAPSTELLNQRSDYPSTSSPSPTATKRSVEVPSEVSIPPTIDNPTSPSPTSSPSVYTGASVPPGSDGPTSPSPTELVTPEVSTSPSSDAPTSPSPTSLPSSSPTIIESYQPTDCYDLYGITESDIIEQTGSEEPIPEDSIRVISGEGATLTIGE